MAARQPLTPERIAAVKDEDIDFSDIPELDEAFWREAEPVESEQGRFRAPGSNLSVSD